MSAIPRWAIVTWAIAMSRVATDDAVAQSCFTGRPRPACSTFWITEAGLSARLDEHGTGESASVTLELGYMANSGSRSALGAAMFLRGGDPVTAVGVRPRFRYWLGRTSSIDIAPGVVLATGGGQYQQESPTFSGQVAVDVVSGLGFTAQMDVVRYRISNGRNTDLAWFAGARLGGGFGLVGILGFAGLVGLVAATW